jgi:hypothetical protein
MEPTGYDLKEDEDYSQRLDGGDSKDSGSYVEESDGSESGSDLSDMETDSVLDEVQPEAGKEGICISAKSSSAGDDSILLQQPPLLRLNNCSRSLFLFAGV